jgi:trk system potassium uptake protein TrkH
MSLLVFHNSNIAGTLFKLFLGNGILAAFFYYFGIKADFNTFTYREAIGITVLSWLFIPLSSALVYYLSGSIPSLTDSIFESFSGFTTTGSSILTSIENLDPVILLWRSFTHFLGGGGIIVLAVFVLPSVGGTSRELFQNEAFLPGGAHQERIKIAAKRVWLIYVLLNIILFVLLYMGGMSMFESLCHAFGTLATGGFSPLNSSIGTYTLNSHPSSLYFEVVLIVFMLLGAMPFLVLFGAITGKWLSVLKDTQIRFYLLLWLVYIFIVTSALFFNDKYESFLITLRHAAFSVTSIMSTTGYGTEEFAKWPTMARFILFFSMFAGGCAGSTAGGIKIIRSIIGLLQLKNAVRSIVHPKTIYSVRLNNQSIGVETLRSTNAFIISFLLTYAIGVFLISIDNGDFETAASAVIACMSGVGPGTSEIIGATGNFSGFSNFSKLVLCWMMVLGRLEILPVLAFFVPGIWKK